ncbi:ABC transporter ATP-binding protein [Corynebacterium freiburgense]|uniref:ABC transporter ATP-binding protein n=1 Tax=Corynebacterium freiburgense TaxID=556548 RepID=UPI000422E65D|nr:ABC transporter ATP-binding protein [Corynebacterium freiburgense]WJZ01731.1 Daunorubicin/doxorubicin resistance ATP-binding protein DrrA [Corynebacterium freiburgense]
MNTQPIEIVGLTKRYGTVAAVDTLNLEVRTGTVHGFLGPNGAGKSTTIRALLGLIRPDAGSIKLLGQDPVRNPAVATRRVAYIPGDVALWPHLTGGQALTTLARLRDRTHGDNPKRRAELIERFAFDPTKRIRAYSKGNRQKIMIIAALAADVDVLVLDEPTSGLDPLMEREFASCIRERVNEGASVLLSSHILSEVQELADDITIIRNGKVVETGQLQQLTHLHGSRITATLPNGSHYDAIHSGDDIPTQLQTLLHAQATHITCTPAGLEDIFMDYYHKATS